jgi:hypothetical protein
MAIEANVATARPTRVVCESMNGGASKMNWIPDSYGLNVRILKRGKC